MWFLVGTAVLIVAASALEVISGWWPRVAHSDGPWFSDLPQPIRRRLSVALWRGDPAPAWSGPEVRPYAVAWLSTKLAAPWRPASPVFITAVLGINLAGADPAPGWEPWLWLLALLGPVWVLLRGRWWRTAELLNRQQPT